MTETFKSSLSAIGSHLSHFNPAQRCDHTSGDQELPCQQSFELTAIFYVCFRGIAPYSGTIKQFTENKSIN